MSESRNAAFDDALRRPRTVDLTLGAWRPREAAFQLAAATVKDFDPTESAVRLSSKKGKGSKLKVRHTILDGDGHAFFAAQAKGKLPSALLFTEDGMRKWRRENWAEAVRNGVTAHNDGPGKKKGAPRLPPGMGCYAFRHSRISELLQICSIDPLTVAAQVGTGLNMIEKNYHKLIQSDFKKKLARLRTA